MTVPMPFQREGATWFHKHHGRALCADEMGLGKTFQVLLYMRRHHEQRPAVVVCPAFLREHWRREAAVHVGMRAEVLTGTKPPAHGFGLRPQLVVVGYETLHAWLPWLRQLRPRLVVIDESHRIKEMTTRCTQSTFELCNGSEAKAYKVPYVLALTGTPILNRVREVWPVAHLLWPQQFPYWQPFADRYCAPRLIRGQIKYDGASNLDELSGLLRRCGMIRRRKQEVLDQLPPKRRVVFPLELENRSEYDRAEKDFLRWLAENGGFAKARRAASAPELNRWAYLKRLAAQLKLKNVFAWIDNYLESGDDKLLVFAVHRDIVAAIADRYKDVSIRIDGGTPAARRVQMVDDFNRSNRLRLLSGNIKAASVGLSVRASTVAFAEIWWVPADHDQAEARISGIGRGITGKHSTSVYLVGRDTVEEKLLHVLERKGKVINAAVDGGKGDAFDVFALLEQEYRKEKGGLLRRAPAH